MGAAAHTLPVDRESDWLGELKQILERWDEISLAAQNTVVLVVESLLRDPESTAGDVDRARMLLERSRKKSAAVKPLG
jgi:hypothetical protein